MLILVTIAVLGLLFALVTWRRHVTTRWEPEPTRIVGAPGDPWCATVWVQKMAPRRSLRAGRDRVTGELCVHAATRIATFRVPDGQQVQLTKARSVTVGARGTDFVNTWVEVDCDVDGQRMVVYLNDAKWLGWRPLLTGANTRLADALAQIRVPGGARP